MQVAITGGPRTGKTTMARGLDAAARSTDEYQGLGWSNASAVCASWFSPGGPAVAEGVAIPRALRKWLKTNPGRPCDEVVVLRTPRVARSNGQIAMGKGVETVMREIEPELLARGVTVRWE